ncbi:alpha/beta hydrolase [Sphingomonas psychrotolerans]|uniref:Alpha/beta hydrolase n=1 Tax=Sphingomonas psychrotolerans TaxID=1327635 RepID=A0ABU3N6N9_9SPHN|nr:alpha/beta hydrolase [Sphingomonas psychrotolerans]MDT8760198.1 alpha/beta hydrolase [Sphingomonas psychrotolerans]
MNPPALADGIAHYVELFRAQPPAGDLETMRLLGDLSAGRFAQDFAPAVDRYDSFIAAPGREIAVRVFDPGGDGARPAICYFHGGGFSMGSVESFDIACAALAEASGAVVVSVHYRRLPDVDYPAAQDDCDRALSWLGRQAATLGVDPYRVAVAGDSAGALFALATAAQAREAVCCLLLFYGTFAMDPARPDYAASRDPLLTGDRVRSYIALFRGAGGHSAPLDRTDLPGLPPTHIVAAEYDPLCGEAVALAEWMRAAGVAVSLQHAPGMIHGFLRAVGVSAPVRDELARAAAAVRPFLEGSR